MPSNPLDVNDLRARIQSTLTTFIDAHEPILGNISPDAVRLVTSLRGLVAGGKRLRPAFAYWGYRATGRQDSDEIVRASASLEFLQACALIHDDVMDDSDTRRGNPSTHKQFEALHASESLRGDAEKFGEGAAILIGDLALSWADELLYSSGLDFDQLQRAKGVYDVMRTELMAGQFLDLLEQARGNADFARATNVIRYKSAKYTIERPLLMGAAIGMASPDISNALSSYGLALGEAFQLRDDVLGVFGDQATTGKPAGDDLREGKETVLIAYARERGDDHTRAALAQSLGNAALDAAAVDELRHLLTDCGALAAVEDHIEAMFLRAEDALQEPTLNSDATEALRSLALIATQRTS